MVLLNGSFSWFTKLPEVVQTLLVAATLFSAGLGGGYAFHEFRDVPEDLQSTTALVDTLRTTQQQILVSVATNTQTSQDISEALQKIVVGLDTVKWQVNIIACYQEAVENGVDRDCLERAGVRSQAPIIPSPTSAAYSEDP